MRQKNNEIIESYQLVTARYDISIYGQRLILRLAQMVNERGYVSGEKLKEFPVLRDVSFNTKGETVFFLPLTDLMGTSRTYNAVKVALRKLMNQTFEWKNEGNWEKFSILTNVEFDRQFGAKITVAQEFFNILLDFRRGYRIFDLEFALKLKSSYSLRLYLLMAGQRKPLIFNINDLKAMLIYRDNGKAMSYKNTHDFICCVIEPAKKELDKCSPYTFNYKTVTSSKKAIGRAAITAIIFFPVRQSKAKNPELRIKNHSLTPCGIRDTWEHILMEKINFDKEVIQANRHIFNLAAQNLDLTKILDDLAMRVGRVRPKNPTGYVVNAIKMELDSLGIDY